MTKQLFNRGDWVRVAKDLGSEMSHFTADCEAIVLGSYSDQFGRAGEGGGYSLHLKGRGSCSWYQEWQLTLIEPKRIDKLEQWETEYAAEVARLSDLDWIFANGKEVAGAASGASAQALATCFGLTNLWGPQGEGIVFDFNARRTLDLARPFLIVGDKAGWLARCEEIKQLMKNRAAQREPAIPGTPAGTAG